MAVTATALPAPLRRSLTGNVSLVTGTMIVSNLLRIASTVILTRLLSPADFGVAGITAAVLAVLMMISDLGFGVFIVQHPRGDDPTLLDRVWTIRLLRGGVLTALLMLAAGPCAHWLAKPEMAAVIAVTSLHFLVEALGSLAPLAAVRQQKLVTLSLLDIMTAVAQTAIGIGLAVVLRSYWAIVAAGVLSVGLRSALSYPMFGQGLHRLRFDRAVAAELWRFGRTIAGAHTVQVLLSQVDRVVLLRLFPLNLFGLYTLAANLAGAPSAFTSLYPNRILLPAYARAWREAPATLAAVYYGERRLVMLLYLIAMGGLIATAGAVTHILYDARYAGAADYLRILAIAPLFALNNYAAREVLIVVGRVQTLFTANLVRLAWLAVAGTGGFLMAGPIGLIWAVGTIEVPVQIYGWGELRRAGVLRWREEGMMLGAAGTGLLLGGIAERLFFAIAD